MSKKEQPSVDNAVEKQKIKKRPSKKMANKGDTIKVDLSKTATEQKEEVAKVDLTNESQEKPVENDSVDETRVVGSNESTITEEKQEEVPQETEAQESVLEEVTEQEVKQTVDEVKEAIVEAQETGKPLPENVQKLVDFMDETGGTIEDYVSLNRDISDLDNMSVLVEYYKKTKPHLSAEEVNFLMEDNFNYDEEIDEDRDIKRKKLAFKEEVATAKKYLEDQKAKYYQEIKSGSRLTPEAQKAMDFFNRYNKESEQNKEKAERQRKVFDQKTNQLFNNEFKGFEYNVGDKRFRYNVKNTNEIKNTQSDINNFVKKFLADDGTMSDAQSYHKSLFTAMNADAIAQHFYEQGKADAIKNSIASGKNVDMQPRQSHGQIDFGGVKYKVVSGDTSNDFKIKSKKRN
jgi:hypothetical protein